MGDLSNAIKLHRGQLLWSGEHWINALRTGDREEPTAWISLFHTRYSPVGEGTAAQVFIPAYGIDIVATDNREVGAWITDRFFARSTHVNAAAPVVDATFMRQGSTQRDPSWLIEAGSHRITAQWEVTEPPTIASGSFSPGTEHWTILFFTDRATVQVNGKRVDGRPYPRDIWQASIGGRRSSCVFALAETLLEFTIGERE